MTPLALDLKRYPLPEYEDDPEPDPEEELRWVEFIAQHPEIIEHLRRDRELAEAVGDLDDDWPPFLTEREMLAA